MWGRRSRTEASAPEPTALKDAVREARIEASERSAVVVDLRDAELARLELLNEALDPVFNDVPAEAEMFDRGISRGEFPRLWIDVVAHIEMGRDKRQYRFVQDTRYGRAVLAESYEVLAIVRAVMRYVAGRLVERERALSDDSVRPLALGLLRIERRRRRLHTLGAFVVGLLLGILALFIAALLSGSA